MLYSACTRSSSKSQYHTLWLMMKIQVFKFWRYSVLRSSTCSMAVQLLCRSDCPVWLSGSASSDSEVCIAQTKLEGALCSTFRHTRFRPGQLKALLSVCHGKDVFVRMPTGGGKSLCMFLVPVSLDGGAIGIVISQLVGLIE